MTQQEKKKIGDPKIVTDAVEVAEEAGLRYVSADQPGYTRKAKGDDFEYFDTEGKPIRDEQRLLRIKGLAIPPAYNGCVDLSVSQWTHSGDGARCARPQAAPVS